jgi:hypothetical protein
MVVSNITPGSGEAIQRFRHSGSMVRLSLGRGMLPPPHSCRSIPAAGPILDIHVGFEVRHVLNQFVNHHTGRQASPPHSRIDRANYQVPRRGHYRLTDRGRYQRLNFGLMDDHELALDAQTACLPENHKPHPIDVNDERDLTDSRFRLTPGALREASIYAGIEHE